VATGTIVKAFIFLVSCFHIFNIENLLEKGLVLATGDLSDPLDKGKRKATDDDIYESLDKGKRRAIDYDSKDENNSNKGNQNNDSDSSPEPDSPGSDIPSDPELNDDIQESIDHLKGLVKDKPDMEIYEQIDTLEQLLHYRYKRREPLPPVPDF
jgi:hypothetical protein